MFSNYLKRLKQNNYDDVMNYIATQTGYSPAEFDNKTQSGNAKVRAKAVNSIKQFFDHNGLVQKTLDEVENYLMLWISLKFMLLNQCLLY